MEEFKFKVGDVVVENDINVTKVKMTIAEMLVKGPPAIPLAHCEKK